MKTYIIVPFGNCCTTGYTDYEEIIGYTFETKAISSEKAINNVVHQISRILESNGISYANKRLLYKTIRNRFDFDYFIK